MHNKSFSLGRSARSDRERNRKRQEAYKWRDARRIYLANSFDRWRKLRCSLGMRDSMLAWHLMEAHEKGQCCVCRRDMDKVEDTEETSKESEDFHSLLVKALKKLCHSQFRFEDCIKIVGLLCLEFDNSRKEKFSVDETISAKTRHSSLELSAPISSISSSSKDKNCSTTFECYGEKQANLDSSSNLKLSDSSESDAPSITTIIIPNFPESEKDINTKYRTEMQFPVLEKDLSIQSSQITNETYAPKLSPGSSHNATQSGNPNLNQDESLTCDMNSTSCVESEAEVSAEIDVEKVDTSQEMEESFSHGSIVKTSDNEVYEGQREISLSSHKDFNQDNCRIPVSSDSNCSADNQTSVSQHFGPSAISNIELPLDMTLVKTETGCIGAGDEMDKTKITQNLELFKDLPVETLHFEPKMDEVEESFHLQNVQRKKSNSILPKSSSRPKDEILPSIPWQRRDMSRKEEYEFLELNPFSDLSEFSQRYPHVHQRTYYRWKRRIKEEYILLEQCPHMSFDQFSSVVLQAKESVFKLWKSFISQGKGFFAPSDVSKRLEAKCQTSKAVNTLSEQYAYLQKNVSCSQEQFCQQFPNTSTEVFIALKKKVLQEIWVFYHNQHLEWKDFSKLVDVSEEIYNIWKDSVSRDIKSAMSYFSSSAQIPSPYSSLQADTQTQLLKANLPTFDSSVEESISRTFSANYLSSVQNALFPWQSYYGVHSPLNPMMLWPRMMGLNGNTSNSLALPSFVAGSSSCGNVELPKDVNSLKPQSSLLSYPGVSDNLLEKTKIPSHSKEQEQDLQRMKRSSFMMNRHENSTDADHCKKQKVKEEMDIMNSQSPVNKSRKQNKQEYIYYLKNPLLTFKDLETLFPAISLRTFYRWRKEMNSALLFIQEKKNPDYLDFKLVFPDIPEEVFEIWKSKSGKENFAGSLPFPDNEHHQEEHFETSSNNAGVQKRLLLSEGNADSPLHMIKNEEYSVSKTNSSSETSLKEACLYVHQNPNVDYGCFSQTFPSISSQCFYHWVREWKDGIDFLHTNPGMTYESCKVIKPHVNEEMFKAWEFFLSNKKSQNSSHFDITNVEPEKEMVEDYCDRKLNSMEFNYLQLNPEIEFDQFNKVYPYISHQTFYQEKKELQKIINYIRSQPSISFEELSAVIPDITEEAFKKWKELIDTEKPSTYLVGKAKEPEEYVSKNVEDRADSNHDTKDVKGDEEAKTKMTKALLHLMHNPNIQYCIFVELFPFVSIETFELWLDRIKAVILHVSSNPSLTFEEFRSGVNDIEEEIFLRWKSLTVEEISTIGKQVVSTSSPPETHIESLKSYKARALLFCQENPDMTYESFSSQYSNISETDFKCWMLKISTQISFIRENKNLIFEDFKGIYPEVERNIFDLWKTSSKGQFMPNFLETPFDKSGMRKEESTDHEHRLPTETTYNNKSLFDSVHISSTSVHLNNNLSEEKDLSLKKLCKLAESDPVSCGEWNSRQTASSIAIQKEPYCNILSKQCSNPTPDYSHDEFQNHNSSDNSFAKWCSQKDPVFNRNDNSSSLCDKWYGNGDRKLEQFDSVSMNHENQSLSALMVMLPECHSFSPMTSTPKMEKDQQNMSQSTPTPGKGKNIPSVSGKEDEEMFSSQRQKKMSRAEYLFVKDNPDVDSQEFARIFPGVSARTFYRWKKEIKAQMQIA